MNEQVQFDLIDYQENFLQISNRMKNKKYEN